MNKLLNVLSVFFVSASVVASEQDRVPPAVFNRVCESLVTLTGELGSGSGFVVEMDDAVWLMTNEHVVRGQGVIRARTISGRKIIPTNTIDLASNRDLIRYKLDGKFKALKWRARPPQMNEQIWVLGNSDGAGVITSIGGEVIGIAGDKIEVDAKFVAGNSGSPVIDANGDVIGIATYAEINRNYRDWVKSDTRFSQTRRFALTLGGVEWEPLGYKQYCDDSRVLSRYTEIALAFMSVTMSAGTARNSKPMWELAKNINKRYAAAANSTKTLRKAFGKIVTADTAYEKAVKAHGNTKHRMETEYGKIGRPTETTLKRREKDVDKAYELMVVARKEGLVVVRKVISECTVKSKRSRSQLEELIEKVDEVSALFDEVCVNCPQSKLRCYDRL